ncbi:MtrAB system histidine kinase MtrB [Streptomyces lycii]|uniref:MtrAB system histidine kinase MtrB n=1 Tax=Streptomyces lycii TaxID=2654337 RepID=UPI001EED04F4|nr:MtrAB system histidine kinase MtrB [Streptomyces lycii]
MSGHGAAPERNEGRPVDPVSRISLYDRLWQGGSLLQDGAPGGPAHPVLRLVLRWVRRPLLPALRLWRRNIQLRVVAGTLLMSLGVVLLLGLVVIGQVRNGLQDAKQGAAQSQAAGGFKVAQDQADADSRGETGRRTDDPAQLNSGVWLTALVEQLASGGQGVYSIVALSSDSQQPFVDDSSGTRSPRSSGDVQPELSVPQELRDTLDEDPRTHQQYTRVVRGSGEGEPALAIGKQLNDVNGNPYQLYYLFPFTQEEKTLSLVKTTLATAGVFVVVLLGAIAWLVVRQVVTPVRMAAGISERLAAGLLQERMKVTGEDDIARLGESFNKMAQNLQLKIQQLEDLSRMQRRFVSDVSHELRTPLTTVRMAADVIHDEKDSFDPATARSAELLRGQLDRFESLLADLLEISRFDAGAAALEAEPVDLRDVVSRVIEGAEPLAVNTGSRIVVRGAEQPVVAEVDARRIERVLRNLVVNAVEHGEGRDVVVRLAAAGGAVAVAVRDYGVGLKPGEATRVFNRFWRADPARARTTGGTGLGLSIAVEDARLHGGWLQAWGEPGGGSQFRLTLPRTADDSLRGSPIPLEPEDSRRGLREAAEPPAAGATRAPGPPPLPRNEPAAADGAASSADPASLPGSGARVVSRAGGVRENEGRRAPRPPGDGATGGEHSGNHGSSDHSGGSSNHGSSGHGGGSGNHSSNHSGGSGNHSNSNHSGGTSINSSSDSSDSSDGDGDGEGGSREF